MNHSVYLIVTSLKLSHTNLFVNNLESRLLNRKGKKAVNSKKITLCQKNWVEWSFPKQFLKFVDLLICNESSTKAH